MKALVTRIEDRLDDDEYIRYRLITAGTQDTDVRQSHLEMMDKASKEGYAMLESHVENKIMYVWMGRIDKK